MLRKGEPVSVIGPGIRKEDELPTLRQFDGIPQPSTCESGHGGRGDAPSRTVESGMTASIPPQLLPRCPFRRSGALGGFSFPISVPHPAAAIFPIGKFLVLLGSTPASGPRGAL